MEEAIAPERAAELREFPQKGTNWTRAESLALYELEDGEEVIAGVPVPNFVRGEDDRVRWANCLRIAYMMFREHGDAPWSQLVLGQARVMFFDREKFV